MTKLRKLQRACSLGDFFEAREVTHDIFLSRIKMGLGLRGQSAVGNGNGPRVEWKRGGWSDQSPILRFPFSQSQPSLSPPTPQAECCHRDLAKPTRRASLFSLLGQPSPSARPPGSPIPLAGRDAVGRVRERPKTTAAPGG